MRTMLRTVAIPSATLLLTLAAVTACGQPKAEAPSREGESAEVAPGQASTVDVGAYVDVTAEQLHGMMESKDFTLVNVHVPFAGDISGTDVSVPYDEIGTRAEELLPEKDARIVLYCRSGHMSAEASATLVALGYTSVYNLTGGMQAWQAAGY